MWDEIDPSIQSGELSVAVKWLAVKTTSEMTYAVSDGAINSTQSNPIQSGEKDRTDLSGRSGRGHLHRRLRPRPVLKLNKLRRHPAAQMGVAKSDFSRVHQSRSDLIKNA